MIQHRQAMAWVMPGLCSSGGVARNFPEKKAKTTDWAKEPSRRLRVGQRVAIII